MKKSFGILLALTMVVGLAFLAAQPASAAAPLEIKFSTQNPTAAWIHPNGYVAWAKKMEEATEGRVKVTIYPAQTLGKAQDFYELVKTGVADLTLGLPTYTPGVFPLTDVLSLPFYNFKNAAQAGRIYWMAVQQFKKEFEAEYKDVKLIGMVTTGPNFFATINKPVKTLDDLKGLKIRIPGGRPAEVLSAAGASPSMIPMPEVYISLEKGIIDGTTIPWEGVHGYIPLKSTKYISLGWGLHATPFFIIMNNKTWDKLSDKDKQAVMNVWGAYGSEGFSKAVWDDCEPSARKMLEENKIQVVDADPAALKKITEMAQPINQKFIDELKAKKLPAQEVYDFVKKAVAEGK